MADTKITALAQLTAATAADFLPIVDDSDTGMAASGTNKYINPDDFFGASTALPYNVNMDGTAGNGVRFNGGDIMAAYDVGTFTPTLYGVTTAGSHTYSNQAGRYVLVGKMCFVSVYITISTKDGAMDGDIRVSALPFTAAASFFPLAVSFAREWTYTGQLSAYVASGQTYVVMRDENAAGGAGGNIDDADLGTTPDLMLGGVYEVA